MYILIASFFGNKVPWIYLIKFSNWLVLCYLFIFILNFYQEILLNYLFSSSSLVFPV